MVGITGGGLEDILNGIASILWPAVAVVAIIVFRSELKDLMHRLRKGKVLGQEIELDSSLGALEVETEQFASEPLPEVSTPDPSAVPSSTVQTDSVEAEIDGILETARTQPTLSLIQTAVALEREGRRLIAATGRLGELPRSAGLVQTAVILEGAASFPPGSLDAIRAFAEIRNKIVHGAGAVPVDDVLRSIDIGIVLLRRIASVPRERHVVLNPEVPIYGDADAHELLPGMGVLLETTSPGGAVITFRIFPTMRTHFRKGMEVAWEWNNSCRWGPAWYQDPQKGLTKAWDGSMEFVGRDLSEV